MGWDIACQNIFEGPLQWWSSHLWKILLLVFKFNGEQTYIGFFSLSILQVIMEEKKASWWIIFKNHDLSSWNDFQRRQTEVQLVMAIVYLCFNFSVRSSVIFYICLVRSSTVAPWSSLPIPRNLHLVFLLKNGRGQDKLLPKSFTQRSRRLSVKWYSLSNFHILRF